jgi:hypothetical protein
LIGRQVGTAVISKSIAFVSVFVDGLMIPVTEDYIAMTNWITVSGDMGKDIDSSGTDMIQSSISAVV